MGELPSRCSQGSLPVKVYQRERALGAIVQCRMVKRPFLGADGATASRKRHHVVHEAPTSEEVHTSRQLQQLLTFTQDPVRARHGAWACPVCSSSDRPRAMGWLTTTGANRTAVLQALPRRTAQLRRPRCRPARDTQGLPQGDEAC